jgi:hypothetical protein
MEAIKKINKKMKIVAITKKLSEETENFFNEQFWKKIDVVANALVFFYYYYYYYYNFYTQ